MSKVQRQKLVTLAEQPDYGKFMASQEAVIFSSYELVNQEKRMGSLFFLDKQLNLKKQLKMPSGVFRFEFDNKSKDHIYASLTNGQLARIDATDATYILSPQISDNLLLDLSESKEKDIMVTTDSTGNIFIIDIRDNYNVIQSKTCHFLHKNTPSEVWTTGFVDGNTFLTGGDDTIMKYWDLRTGLQSPISVHKNQDMGITFLKASSYDCNEILYGDYNNTFRIYDKRNFATPKHEIELKGGVWHVDENSKGNYLCTCMYGGYAYLEKDPELTLVHEEVPVGENHLFYGAAFIADDTFASCSFYRKELYLDQITNN
uniref:WD_REPEATS_REGION domain-containing protein n=1 Tax=Rhabditophanes sp. KR3021 TaxID=114890 RepID=A0AC35UAQ3_9BILA